MLIKMLLFSCCSELALVGETNQHWKKTKKAQKIKLIPVFFKWLGPLQPHTIQNIISLPQSPSKATF